ncbi:MAG: hypothetical protein WD757_06175 [Actinomycetota bacterium]
MKKLWIGAAAIGVTAAVVAGILLIAGGPESPAPRTPPSPSSVRPALPFEGPTPIELRFCSADEAIFVLESQVAYEDIPLPRALKHLRTSQRITAAQARWIGRQDEAELSRRVMEWSRAFEEARVKISAGTDPLIALRPAIRRRNQIENIFTCELDA